MNHISRKRQRSCEDEACELMPISKRINDLHIRSGFPERDSSVAGSKIDIQASISQNSKSSSNVSMTDLTKESFAKDHYHCTYEPELSVAENPYYYHVNEVLFEAHIQRLQRLSRIMS